ncbi:MAG TPA: hypothetical protein VEQ66_03935 [Propionibacteriaceae bacterium]|nr:hypothetical protein [Propionibacteriaceae bacterium]
MTRSQNSAALALAAGVLTLGAGVGVASLASADPTPKPSAPALSSPSVSASPVPQSSDASAHWGHRGFGRGHHQQELASQLADKLDVSQDKVATALQKFRAERPTEPPTTGNRPDPAEREENLATFLAGELDVDQAKVKTALQEIRAALRAERASALKPRLEEAVKSGTLTQAEADAVTKAVQQGVINAGPR